MDHFKGGPIKSKLFNFDLNVLTCNSNFAVNKLFSNLNPEAKLHCSLVDVIVSTPKIEILCAYSKCIEIEARGSWKVGTGRIIGGDKTEKTKIEGNRGVSTKGQFNMRVVDKSKKTP